MILTRSLIALTAAAIVVPAGTVAWAGTPTRVHVAGGPSSDAPTTQQCLRRSGIRCYSPAQLNRAYGVTELHNNQGVQGQGHTIAIVMNRYEGLKQDLRYASQNWGLPKPRIRVVHPAGKAGTLGDPVEPSLDVQTVHSVAPRAKILFLAVPSSSLSGAVLEPKPLAEAIRYETKQGVTAISMSFGGLEQRYAPFRRALKAAHEAGIAIFTGSGDDGVYLPAPGLPRKRMTVYPATDPHVTAVGGTSITLDGSGARLTDDVAWSTGGNQDSSGGGVSKLNKRPKWQRVPGTSSRGRNYPDISLAADPAGSSFTVRTRPQGTPTWLPVGGTSHSTPYLAAVTTLASQLAGKPLPNVNPAIYKLSQRRSGGVDDIVWGWNYFVTPEGNTIQGYVAVPGYDRVTGVGTFSTSGFIRALARYAQ